MSLTARIANRVWLGSQHLAYRRFRAALAQPRRNQEAILRGYLNTNAETEFGRQHGFDRIRSVADFQSQVPLSEYTDYGDPIERIAAGEQNILSASPVRMLEPSSGSSSARKLVPYTQALQTELRRAIAPWLVDLARTIPSIQNGRSYWAITPAMTETEMPNTIVPVGFDSDSAYLGGWLAWLTQRVLLDCEDLRYAGDIREFRRLTLLRLLAARDLSLISVWHPSFLTLLLEAMSDNWETLLRDIETGVTADGLMRGVAASRPRALELSRLDPTDLQAIWPGLALVSCWGDGHAARDREALAQLFPHSVVQSKGLLATEACISIPFAGSKPLAIRSHFFEFVDSKDRVKMSWELEQGETYSVVVTTGGGFYRYRLLDRIAVDGFVEKTPSVRFVGKEDSVSDLRGEKLSDAFVADILGRLLPALAPDAGFAMLAPSVSHATPGYTLFVQSDSACEKKLRNGLEKELERNPNYAHCVRLGQLATVSVQRVGRNATEIYLEKCRSRGMRLGVIKPIALSPLTDWDDALNA